MLNEVNIEEKIKEADKEWKNIKINRQKYQIEELLDKYAISIEGDDKRANKKKKKVLKRIRENECRLWSFKYIISNIDRGENSSLKKL